MKQPKSNLLRVKIIDVISAIRKIYFKWLGLSIGKKVILGRITCHWPANVKIGNHCSIQDRVDFRISHPFSEDNRIEIGDRVLIGRCCEFNCGSKITIGNDCLIASNTSIIDVGHQFSENIPINKQAILARPINIGDDVWIGSGCKILQGVTIGQGSIIGAGSIINKSIPAYQIWAGVPAKFVKNRF